MQDSLALLEEAEQLCDKRQWPHAEQLLRQAVAQEPQPVTHIALGAFLAERQSYSAAISEFMAGLDSAESTGDLAAKAVIFSNLAAIYRDLEDRDQAQRFQQRALALSESADAGDLLAWSRDALQAGKFRLAAQLARQALDLEAGTEDITLQAEASGQLGVIAAREGKLRRAAWLLIRSARGHQYLDDDRGLGIAYQNLAEVFGRMDRPRWQMMCLEAARNCFERTAMPVSLDRITQRLQEFARLAARQRMDARRN